MTAEAIGRRARKNMQTRQALADAATRLFLEKGYDHVTIKEIADAVDVSAPTVFKHVPDGKEAIIFDNGAERLDNLLAAVRERRVGQSVMSALREFMAGRGPFLATPSPEIRRRTELIMSTPALRDYSRKLWIRCEAPLTEALAAELGQDPNDVKVRAVARYVLEIPQFLSDEPDPRAALDAVFDLLEHGVNGIA